MCNLNILVATRKRLHSREVIEGFINATANSYASNSDAEGMYMSGTNELVKNVWKLNLIPYVSAMRRSLFLLDHTRISTSGFHEKNTQPFRVGRFIVMHNGILTFDKPTPDTTKSDTAYFCDFLMEHFRETKDMHEAIQRTLKDDVRYGSYSIAIFDIEKQILYYFKNTSTSFTIYQEEDFLFMTTSSSNNVFFPYKMKKLTPEANQLYIFAMNGDGYLTAEKKKLDVYLAGYGAGYATVGRQTSLYNDDYYKRSDYWEKDSYGAWHPKSTHDRALPPAREYTTHSKNLPKVEGKKKKKRKNFKDDRTHIMKWTNPDGSTDESWYKLGMWHNVHVTPSGVTTYRHGKEAEEIRAAMNLTLPKDDDTGDATTTSSPTINMQGYPDTYDAYDY